MDRAQLKQRIVGGLVLVALLAIILPLLLDTEQDAPALAQQEIPAEPKIEDVAPSATPEITAELQSLAEQGVSPDRIIETPSVPSGAPAIPATTPATPAPPSPQTETTPGPGMAVSWVVQLGSFSDEKNALTLRDKLRAKGYAAFVERVHEANAATLRVRVGPEVERSRAEALAKRLDQEQHLKGVVLRYK